MDRELYKKVVAVSNEDFERNSLIALLECILEFVNETTNERTDITEGFYKEDVIVCLVLNYKSARHELNEERIAKALNKEIDHWGHDLDRLLFYKGCESGSSACFIYKVKNVTKQVFIRVVCANDSNMRGVNCDMFFVMDRFEKGSFGCGFSDLRNRVLMPLFLQGETETCLIVGENWPENVGSLTFRI